MASTDHSTTPALAPALTVTPASPTTTTSQSTTQTPTNDTLPSTSTSTNMKDATNKPTESATALLGKDQQEQGGSVPATATTSSTEKGVVGSPTSPTGRTSPLDSLSRRLSGKSAPKTSASKDATDATTTEKKPRSAATTTTTPAPAASTSRAPATTSKPAATGAGAKTGQKKKKKRKGGLAGIFVALGCLSAGDFEDEPKSKAGTSRDMAQKPGSGVTKPAAATTSTATPAVVAKPTEAAGAGTAQTPAPTADAAVPGETASTTAADDARGPGEAAAVPKEAVVVAPIEPVQVPVDETAGVTSSAVQPPGSGSELLSTPHRPSATRRESDTTPSNAAGTSSSEMAKTETSGGYTDLSDSDMRTADEGSATEEQEYALEEEYEDEEDRLIAQGGMGIPLDENGQPAPLLPLMSKEHHGRKCLVLDLDETLLHSSFKMLPHADYIVPVEIESQTHNVYVIKRPGVDNFLTEMGKIYEVVVFTASLSKYADPVLDMLDPAGVVKHRLFRESCYNHKGNYVKDLSQLGRDMEGCIIIDNSPASYIFHPNNAVPVSTWFNDPHDTELTDLCPFLTDLATVDDIRGVLDGSI